MKGENSWERNVPTMPILRLLLGRPRRIFFSCGGAFLGGILFLTEASAAEERENVRRRVKERMGIQYWVHHRSLISKKRVLPSSRLRCNTASAGARLFAHARLSLSTQPLPPMKAFNALTFVFSLLSLVLGQTVTVTNAYVSLLRTFLLAC